MNNELLLSELKVGDHFVAIRTDDFIFQDDSEENAFTRKGDKYVLEGIELNDRYVRLELRRLRGEATMSTPLDEAFRDQYVPTKGK